MAGAPTPDDLRPRSGAVDTVGARIGRFCARPETRSRATAYPRGLLANGERKNGWQLAESLGGATPDGVPYLLARADWSADAVRNDPSAYAHDHLADPEGALVVDETGFVQMGTRSVGAQRPYTGTAGRVDHSQVGVFLASASRHGHARRGRSLYRPQEWATGAERRKPAGVPCDVTFATTPALAQAMVRGVRRPGVRAAWVPGDAVYGRDGKFRPFLASVGQPDVSAVPCGARVGAGAKPPRVDASAGARGAREWPRASAGDGSQGPRWYDWAVRPVGEVGEGGTRAGVRIRRHRDRPDERACYWCWGPGKASWQELVRAAGRRWAAEECFARAKGECGLDEYEVRTWDGWHRHVTLGLFALAVLTVVRIWAGRAKRGRP